MSKYILNVVHVVSLLSVMVALAETMVIKNCSSYNCDQLEIVSCTAVTEGAPNSALVTCMFPFQVDDIEKGFSVTAHNLNQTSEVPDLLTLCYRNNKSLECLGIEGNKPLDISNTSATVRVILSSDASYIISCNVEESSIQSASCLLHANDLLEAANNKDSFPLGVVIGMVVFGVIILTLFAIVIFCCYKRRGRFLFHKRRQDPSSTKSSRDETTSLTVEEITLLPAETAGKETKSTNKPFIQWASEKKDFLLEIKNDTESSSERKIDNYLRECKELQYECIIYINDQRLTAEDTPEKEEILYELEDLNTQVEYTIQQLESKERSFVQMKFQSTIMSSWITDQNKAADDFLQRAKTSLAQISTQKGKDAFFECSTCLKQLLELDVECSHYEKYYDRLLQNSRKYKQPSHLMEELETIHSRILGLQLLFEEEYNCALERFVLRSITEQKVYKSNSDVKDTHGKDMAVHSDMGCETIALIETDQQQQIELLSTDTIKFRAKTCEDSSEPTLVTSRSNADANLFSPYFLWGSKNERSIHNNRLKANSQ